MVQYIICLGLFCLCAVVFLICSVFCVLLGSFLFSGCYYFVFRLSLCLGFVFIGCLVLCLVVVGCLRLLWIGFRLLFAVFCLCCDTVALLFVFRLYVCLVFALNFVRLL